MGILHNGIEVEGVLEQHLSVIRSPIFVPIYPLHNGLSPRITRRTNDQTLKTLFEQSSSGWEVRMSSTHKVPYYFNVDTSSSTWDPPLPKDELRNLPGAHYLDQPGQIRASHLLIKHKDSRRPSSWKEVRGISHHHSVLPTRAW